MFRYYKKLEENFLNLSGLSKYLIYGITEIILLVVGVVIALQVNNWGQQRNDQELEKYYLEALHEEVKKDINDIQEVIEYDIVRLNAVNSLLTLIKEKKSISDDSTKQLWGAILITNGINPNTIVFEDMKSTGRLRLLSSTELRFQIQEYYEYIIEAKNDAEGNTRLIYQWVNEFFIQQGIDINSLYKILSPTIVEVDPYHSDFFTPDNYNDIVERLTVRYTLTELNQNRYYNAIEMAKALEEELSLYLEELD